jgi:hypothetical protein
MIRAALLALALSFGVLWAADLVDAGNHYDPNGATATTDAGNHADPNGATATTDAGNHYDPNG